LENIMVGLHCRTQKEFFSSLFHLPGVRREEKGIEEKAREILDFFHLETKGHWPAAGLSYGDQKRIEMARALASKPDLVLLDEPVAGLNMTETREIADLICRVRSQGISVLLVEHDMNLVMGISEKIVVLNYGQKIAEGSPEAIQKDPQVLTAYLGTEV
jgi:branched-chain amino acid transport system ATP-binding protein